MIASHFFDKVKKEINVFDSVVITGLMILLIKSNHDLEQQ